MVKSLIRSAIDALLPPGVLWNPEPDKGFDQQLDGISDVIDESKVTIDSLGDIRNPYKTPCLNDLERNFGINPNPYIALDIRKARLSQKIDQGKKVNSIDDLQADLNKSGFNVLVHKNDPPVDPSIFGGELLVNTPIITQNRKIEMCSGGSIAYAGYKDVISGNVISVVGYFVDVYKIPYQYDIPINPVYWPMIFFVGGNATRNPATGELLTIATANVGINREDDFKSLILNDKTLGAWCVLVINFT